MVGSVSPARLRVGANPPFTCPAGAATANLAKVGGRFVPEDVGAGLALSLVPGPTTGVTNSEEADGAGACCDV